jgi:hypothetical protein
MLCVLAQALLAALRARLPGYAAVTPDTLMRATGSAVRQDSGLVAAGR